MIHVICKGLLVALLLWSQASVRAEVYRWIDENGQVHFGDQAREARTYAIKPQSGSSAQGDQQQRMDKTRKLLNAYQIERQQAREQQAQQREKAEKSKRNCNRARDDLRKYTEVGNIYRLGEDGEREYLSERERASLLQRSRQAVAHWCGRS